MTNPIVLVVEDNAISRKMLRLTLAETNYTLLEASDGQTALTLATQYPVDLILQDIILPDMDGYVLIKKLRAIPHIADIPIIAMSGFLNRFEELQTTDGFTAFLIKPVQPSHILATLKTYLPQTLSAPAATKHNQHILIADDDPAQLKLLRLQLTHAGFRVSMAQNGQEALQQIAKQLPDAVISDILMPYVDGFELCVKIRQNPLTTHIPVILCTSHYQEESDKILAEKVGANYYITRTPNISNLLSVLEHCLTAKTSTKKVKSVDLFKEEHTHRLIRQLERQVAANIGLAERCALQTTQLSLLGGVAEALTNRAGIENTLQDVLITCFDAAGISQGALYLTQADNSLRLRQSVGYTPADYDLLQDFFGHPEILTQVFTRRCLIQIPSPAVPEATACAVIAKANVSSALLVPLLAGNECLGLLWLGSKVTNVTSNDPMTFAHTLGTQIAQTIALAAAFEHIHASEQRYRALMDNASSGILIGNNEGIFVETNKQGEKIFNTTKQHIIGKHFQEFIAHNDKMRANKIFEQLMRDGVVGPDEIDVQPVGKTKRHTEFSAAVVKTPELLFITVVNDVTERNQLRAQSLLNDKLAAVGTLAAGIAHEINNPVGWLLANLEFLKEKTADLSHLATQLRETPITHDKLVDWSEQVQQILLPFKEVITESIQGAHRVRDIVRGLKGFTRIDEAEKTTIDVHEILNTAINMATPKFKYHATVEKTFAPDLPLLCGHSGKLHQVFLNLIINAAQALPETANRANNKIYITTRLEDPYVRIDIQDTGIGIAPEILPKIFDPFFTTKPVGEGTGLGLAICHEIIQHLGGKISVQSTPAKGTTFSVYLPYATKPASIATKTPLPSQQMTRRHILVVDDEPYLLNSIQRMLTASHDITTAVGGRAAIELLSQQSTAFDLILADLSMPDVSGADLYHFIIQNRPAMGKRIIFMTGGAYTPALKTFLSGVPCLKIDKPFDKAVLLTLIEQCINTA